MELFIYLFICNVIEPGGTGGVTRLVVPLPRVPSTVQSYTNQLCMPVIPALGRERQEHQQFMVILGELEVNMVFKRKEREKGTPTTDPMYQNEINSTSKQRQGNRTSRQQTGGGGVLSRVGAPPPARSRAAEHGEGAQGTGCPSHPAHALLHLVEFQGHHLG